MTKSVKRLHQKLRVRLGIFPIDELSKSDALERSVFKKAWNVRQYPSEITPPVTVLTRPMMSMMTIEDTQNIELDVMEMTEVSEGTVEFYLQFVSSLQSPVEGLPYVSLLEQPLEAIRELHPDASQLAPLSGVHSGQKKLILTSERPNQKLAYSKPFGTKRELEPIDPNALHKQRPVTIIDLVKRATPPGTLLPKPEKLSEVVSWYVNKNGEEHLKYEVGQSDKTVSVSDIQYSHSQLIKTGEFTRSWFGSNLDSSSSAPCHFTTIGAIFILLGIAQYGGLNSGIYQQI